MRTESLLEFDYLRSQQVRRQFLDRNLDPLAFSYGYLLFFPVEENLILSEARFA